ncbi:MAG: NAD-dependent dehydratase [Deltaproteobacteria bacterium RIFCSPLOWO2_12_FULL_44_12]|nr:MAG: NAD-dependent dehydratase [Deltaproteobacteria bacterium RIFCSPHIGHO2_01_FULL_43_49]OGQ15316.1 MAG: NAD-dependent dehydratase [Deltaproteobacteria bacterium RIFCSPHIGHO2_02_FULL_44_53]OGQ27323.1 MAG: NAD-dependent dehydratase [Deltaproteobacteria bacterium RIFCSPHIGHO2_12_FULL_44_21]OGQ31832.1 MAG: NAD-dependent dehydratase [Deltaproteobacteria bacterium RIFCSPLOWO2_01_FULL_45_74]OGQ43034.1 MAG: NAD-dependent dehydratase [Deltaproteobacteria bacterium RIFCSPLOWO2_02_FULL_44_34]OGQ70361
MKTLITGGAGFIGSHLVERLLKDNHEVVVLDNFSTGRIQNLDFAKNNPHLKIHETDITDHKTILPCFENIDWVFHLAALADIVPSIQRPLEYHRANVEGTASVVEAARKSNVKRFLYAASSSCYGFPDTFPTPETAPARPQYPYALTKYLGEAIVTHWAKIYKIPAISLRLFNVYGPRQRTSGTYGAVFGVFLAQKLKGKPYTIIGDGNQTRDFIYVTDIVEAFVKTAGSALSGMVLNVGCAKPQSINYLVKLLKGEAIHIPKRPGEPDITFADISKIQQKLGWNPKISFEEGVQKMLENIDYWKEAPVWDENSIAKATIEWFANLK